jgi:hypothetical protein
VVSCKQRYSIRGEDCSASGNHDDAFGGRLTNLHPVPASRDAVAPAAGKDTAHSAPWPVRNPGRRFTASSAVIWIRVTVPVVLHGPGPPRGMSNAISARTSSRRGISGRSAIEPDFQRRGSRNVDTAPPDLPSPRKGYRQMNLGRWFGIGSRRPFRVVVVTMTGVDFNLPYIGIMRSLPQTRRISTKTLGVVSEA